MEDINNFGKNELNNNEVENNIWVQVTKETFDYLLLGNETLDNNEDTNTNKNNTKI